MSYRKRTIVICAQTLCTLLRAIFQKKLSDRSFDVIDIMVGFDSAECQMRVSELLLPHRCHALSMSCTCAQNLIESLSKFIAEYYPGMFMHMKFEGVVRVELG
jgi:hypothetical protein